MPVYFSFALTFFNMTGVRAGRVLLALYALKLGAQPFAVGVLAATFSVFPMLLSWQIGRLSDRFGSRWLLAFGAAGGGCGMLVPYFVPGLPALYVAAAMNGLSFAFYNVSIQNLVGLLSSPSTRTKNFSNYTLVISVTSFLGPLLCGFAIDHAGFALTCVYIALLSLVPVAMLVIRGGVLPGGTRQEKSSGGLREALVVPGIWRVLAICSVVQAGIDLFNFYMPIYGHAVNLSASAIGVVLSMFSAAAFVVRLVMPRLLAWRSEETVLAYSLYIGAASFLLVPFFKTAAVLALISFMFGLGMGCGQPITMMLTYSLSAAGRSGETLGLRLTINHLTRVVGPVLFGAIGSVFGLLAVFWVNGLLLASGGAATRSGSASRAGTEGK